MTKMISTCKSTLSSYLCYRVLDMLLLIVRAFVTSNVQPAVGVPFVDIILHSSLALFEFDIVLESVSSHFCLFRTNGCVDCIVAVQIVVVSRGAMVPTARYFVVIRRFLFGLPYFVFIPCSRCSRSIPRGAVSCFVRR